MKKIEAEHTEYTYFRRTDPKVLANGLKVKNLDSFMIDVLPSSQDTRLVAIKNFFEPNTADFYYLYWDDGSDLDALDAKVENNRYTDHDFANSLKTVFQWTECLDCRQRWPTLVIPPGDPYRGSPGLLEQKIKKAKFKQCPKCNAALRQMVVKLWLKEDTITVKSSPAKPGAQFSY